ncbi:MAG TPA: TIGR03435 family protein [Bryobacteraceae bacterium]
MRKHALGGAVVLLSILPFHIPAQPQAEKPEPLTCEVASVKHSAPGGRGGVIRQMPGGQTYVATGVPLRLLMTVAYTVTDRQISGGPSWVSTDTFDITAKAQRPGTSDEMHRMLQTVLEDRFQLKVRRESRESPVWALTVDKGGPKLPEHDAHDLDHPPFRGIRGGIAGPNVSMNYFAFMLSRLLDRNVIDRTGLTANYDVNLLFTPDRPGPKNDGADAGSVPEGPDIFSALREQLGLKLESSKGPVEFLVIEHAEKPSGN